MVLVYFYVGFARCVGADMRRVARKVFDEQQLTMALVGPFRSEKKFASLLKL